MPKHKISERSIPKVGDLVYSLVFQAYGKVVRIEGWLAYVRWNEIITKMDLSYPLICFAQREILEIVDDMILSESEWADEYEFS